MKTSHLSADDEAKMREAWKRAIRNVSRAFENFGDRCREIFKRMESDAKRRRP